MSIVDSCGKPKRRNKCAKKRAPKRHKSRKCGKSSKKSKKNCARPGPVIRNAFFNFLRDFRRQRCGKPMTSISKEAAKKWKCMSICKRSKYIKEACGAGDKCGKKKSRRKAKTRKHRSKSSKRCGAKKRRPKKKKRACPF